MKILHNPLLNRQHFIKQNVGRAERSCLKNTGNKISKFKMISSVMFSVGTVECPVLETRILGSVISIKHRSAEVLIINSCRRREVQNLEVQRVEAKSEGYMYRV